MFILDLQLVGHLLKVILDPLNFEGELLQLVQVWVELELVHFIDDFYAHVLLSLLMVDLLVINLLTLRVVLDPILVVELIHVHRMEGGITLSSSVEIFVLFSLFAYLVF